MTDENNDRRHAVALFRYGLIADLVQWPPGCRGLYQRFEEKSAAEYAIPGSPRTRVAPETLRDWLKRYRHGGFEALMPKPRADRGRSRALPDALCELLLNLKETNPMLSVPLLVREARATGQIPEELPLPPSTVHRLLARHGLMRKNTQQPTERDRRRFAFQQAGELWMSDVMHGPTVSVGDRIRRKTYLIAFLDDDQRGVDLIDDAVEAHRAVFLDLALGLEEEHLIEVQGGVREVHLIGAAALHPGLYRVFYVPLSTGNVMDMYKSIGWELGLPTERNRVVRYHLRGLEREELSHYLTHRLRLAGCELPLIEPPAIEALFQATQGMPRKLNRLAHYALTSAALAKAKSVTGEHVQAALEEIMP